MEMKQKLVQVRRAHRLLAAYNRRILDMVASVQGVLDAQGSLQLKFYYWDPMHYTTPGNRNKNPVGRWGWDFVPLYDVWFVWSSKGSCPVLMRQVVMHKIMVLHNWELSDGDGEGKM